MNAKTLASASGTVPADMRRKLLPVLAAVCVLGLLSLGSSDVSSEGGGQNCCLSYNSEHGTISAFVNSPVPYPFDSGSEFPSEGVLLLYEPPSDNYEFLHWVICIGDTRDLTHSENPLVLSSLDSDAE